LKDGLFPFRRNKICSDRPESLKYKIDEELVHFIKRLHSRYLRVIAKVSGDDMIIVSAFYDRRLKRG